jgi:flagellar biosynthesis/type III secretory pathway chaperone
MITGTKSTLKQHGTIEPRNANSAEDYENMSKVKNFPKLIKIAAKCLKQQQLNFW